MKQINFFMTRPPSSKGRQKENGKAASPGNIPIHLNIKHIKVRQCCSVSLKWVSCGLTFHQNYFSYMLRCSFITVGLLPTLRQIMTSSPAKATRITRQKYSDCSMKVSVEAIPQELMPYKMQAPKKRGSAYASTFTTDESSLLQTLQMCRQDWLWTDCTDVQPDPSLHCSHML